MKPFGVAPVVMGKLLLLLCVRLGLLLWWQPTFAAAQGPDVTANPGAGYQEGVQVTPLLSTSENTIGQAIQYPKTNEPEVSGLLVEIPPGKQTGWHRHPVPLFAYVLSGTLTEEFSDGEKHEFHQGQALAEAVDTPHNAYNAGTEPVKLVVFVLGEKGAPFTVRLKDKWGQKQNSQ